MDFIDQLKAFSETIPNQIIHLTTEEATKNALVMPFINMLGYNVFDPQEVVPEFTCDVGTKKGEKVDYAIMKDGKPIMLFECKASEVNLDDIHASQLYRYFSVSEACIGVLTNGVYYKFFSDLEEKNKMDIRPFMELNLMDIKPQLVEELKRFKKETFEIDSIMFAANELKYSKAIKELIDNEFKSPSDDFTYYITKQVYSARVTATVQDKFKSIITRAFKQFINDTINERLQTAMETNSPEPESIMMEEKEVEEESPVRESGVITTDDEIDAFHIVRALTMESVNPDKVALKDRQRYCNVLYENNVRKPLIRFYFNNPKQYYIELFDVDNGEKMPIEKVSDIYLLKDRINTTLKKYMN